MSWPGSKLKSGWISGFFQFEKREAVDDGFGNTISSDWTSQFQAHCGIRYLKGSETVLASRLEGKSQVILAIRVSANAKLITSEWRAKDMRSSAIYQIKEPPHPTDDRAYLEMLAESGVAG